MRTFHRQGWRVVAIVALLAGSMLSGAGIGFADPPGSPDPPPPTNPSDQQLRDSKSGVADAAGQVGQLTGQLAEAQNRVDQLGSKLEAQREIANKALVDLRSAQSQAAAAAARVRTTQADARAASSVIEDAQRRLDTFIAVAYEQGVQSGALGLLATASAPDDLIQRAELTDAVADDQRAALDSLRHAQISKVNADSLARAAQDQARAKQAEAAGAKRTADNAVASADAAVAVGAVRLRQVQAQRASIEQRLDTLTAQDTELHAQRQRYLDYRNRLAGTGVSAQAAARAVDTTGLAGGVRAVINRALSQLGVSYAWGGGNGGGPTKGIRDGGVADQFGDYHKTGFDCSGLMIYAFKAAGIGLPHYSGYQYNAGKKVPISQIQAGDMLFWADGGTIHHVALYLGNGKMVEAPYSGGEVRITAMRYGDGLMPYATRLV